MLLAISARTASQWRFYIMLASCRKTSGLQSLKQNVYTPQEHVWEIYHTCAVLTHDSLDELREGGIWERLKLSRAGRRLTPNVKENSQYTTLSRVAFYLSRFIPLFLWEEWRRGGSGWVVDPEDVCCSGRAVQRCCGARDEVWEGFVVKPLVPSPGREMVRCYLAWGVRRRRRRRGAKGIEQDTVAQYEHEWHARPLTSLHCSGNGAEPRNLWKSLKPEQRNPRQMKSKQ